MKPIKEKHLDLLDPDWRERKKAYYKGILDKFVSKENIPIADIHKDPMFGIRPEDCIPKGYIHKED